MTIKYKDIYNLSSDFYTLSWVKKGPPPKRKLYQARMPWGNRQWGSIKMYRLIHRPKCNYPVKHANEGENSIIVLLFKKVLYSTNNIVSAYSVKDPILSAE